MRPLRCWRVCSLMCSRRYRQDPRLPKRRSRDWRPSRTIAASFVLLSCCWAVKRARRTFLEHPRSHHFLVKGIPSYMGDRHATFSTRWAWGLKTAESIRTRVPQAKIDFSNSSTEQLEAFLRRINASSVAATRSLLARMIFPQLILLLM